MPEVRDEEKPGGGMTMIGKGGMQYLIEISNVSRRHSAGRPTALGDFLGYVIIKMRLRFKC